MSPWSRHRYNSPMKIVIAPQAFKGSLRGIEAARAMDEGVRRAYPRAETVLIPVADGGDGTLEALVEGPSLGGAHGLHSGPRGRYFQASVTGPLGSKVDAQWGAMANGGTAVIELARASGLALVPSHRRNPRTATTYGTGELIRAALDAGYTEIIVGLGGSATNDGGAGIAQALGARLSDDHGFDLLPGGAALAHLHHIDLRGLDPRLKECHLWVATDVNNRLCGPEGASEVYGPQKGAAPATVKELDAALHHYAQVIQRDIGVHVLDLPRGGAAGGAGAGMVALLGGELKSGGELVCDALGLNRHLEGAALVLTGEGQLDGQTIYDKAPMVVALRAKARGIPVLAIVGSLGPTYEVALKHGITAAEASTPPGTSLEEGIAQAYELVREATERGIQRFPLALS